MHISAHLIESYPREHGSWSWAKEKLSIPLEAHDKAQLSEIFQVFLQKFKELYFFNILAHPAEAAYVSFPDRELCNEVLLVQVRPRKTAVHTFLGLAQARLLRQPSCQIYQKP